MKKKRPSGRPRRRDEPRRLSVWIPRKLRYQLWSAAFDAGKPMGALVTEALTVYLNPLKLVHRRPGKWPRVDLDRLRQVGEMLLEAKAQVEPREWSGWLKRELNLSDAMANYYMTLARPGVDLDRAAAELKETSQGYGQTGDRDRGLTR